MKKCISIKKETNDKLIEISKRCSILDQSKIIEAALQDILDLTDMEIIQKVLEVKKA